VFSNDQGNPLKTRHFGTLLSSDFISDALLRKFIKGIFHSRPNLPKHPVVWDVQVVLDYLGEEEDVSLLFFSGNFTS
jgi:hypothetical protein